MDHLKIKYAAGVACCRPRPIRLEIGGWSAPRRMVDGSNPQPWHLPAVRRRSDLWLDSSIRTKTPATSSTKVRRALRLELRQRAGRGLDRFRILFFSPSWRPKFTYQHAPRFAGAAGTFLRTSRTRATTPTETGTFPLALVGTCKANVFAQDFCGFPGAASGQGHVFRKASRLLKSSSSQKMTYDLELIGADEENERRKREQDVQAAR